MELGQILGKMLHIIELEKKDEKNSREVSATASTEKTTPLAHCNILVSFNIT